MKKAKRSPKKRIIPVTILSGFLGAGKTTTLNHLLENRSGKRIAVIVNDMAQVNIDARMIRETEEKMIQLTNGCICCTLREDLIEQLVDLSESGDSLDAIVVESTGISEPIHVAETFAHAENIEKGKRLLSLVRLDTMVTLIDCSSFFTYFKPPKVVASSKDSEEKNENFACPPKDPDADHSTPPRTLTDLLIDQIQFADVLILNKEDAVSASELSNVRAVITDLNPLAQVITTTHGQVDLTSVINTGIVE